MKQVQIDGLITFWSLTETNQTDIAKAFGDAGFSIVPTTKSPNKSLEDALKHLCKGSTVKKTKKGFAILSWEEHDKSVGIQQTGYAGIADDGINLVTEGNTPKDLWHEYQTQMSRTPPEEIRRGLVTALHSINGVTLRESGGVYWVPPLGCDKWATLCDKVATTGIVNRNKIYQIKTAIDEHTVAAVSDAYIDQINTQLQSLAASSLKSETKLKKISGLEKSAARLQTYLTDLANDQVGSLINEVQVEVAAAALAGIPQFG